MQDFPQPRITLSQEQRQDLLQRYQGLQAIEELSYGTVEDFCDSFDHLSFLTNIQGDLKDLQRPSTLKRILSLLPANASLLEIGAGEPYVAQVLTELGYHVTVVDPYDGSGRGPTEYEYYVAKYPDVRIIRGLFSHELAGIEHDSFDCVYSISVLEHIHQPALSNVFAGLRHFLRPGGYSLHLIDHILAGEGQEFHEQHLAEILCLQGALSETATSHTAYQFSRLLTRANEDLDTYYLSAEGHNRWRGATPYSSFRFRKVISVASCSRYKGQARALTGSPHN